MGGREVHMGGWEVHMGGLEVHLGGWDVHMGGKVGHAEAGMPYSWREGVASPVCTATAGRGSGDEPQSMAPPKPWQP